MIGRMKRAYLVNSATSFAIVAGSFETGHLAGYTGGVRFA